MRDSRGVDARQTVGSIENAIAKTSHKLAGQEGFPPDIRRNQLLLARCAAERRGFPRIFPLFLHPSSLPLKIHLAKLASPSEGSEEQV